MALLAKKTLADTVQALRTRLLDELRDATESASQLSIRVQDTTRDQAARTRRGRLERFVAEQVRGAVEAELQEQRKVTWAAAKLEAERGKIESRLRAGGCPPASGGT